MNNEQVIEVLVALEKCKEDIVNRFDKAIKHIQDYVPES